MLNISNFLKLVIYIISNTKCILTLITITTIILVQIFIFSKIIFTIISSILIFFILKEIFTEYNSCIKRKNQEELIDMNMETGKYTLSEYHENLEDMGKISDLLGSNFTLLNVFKRIEFDSVLDFGNFYLKIILGCGGGWICSFLSKQYPKVKITGIDTSQNAINFASKRENNNINYIVSKNVELSEKDNSYDIVTCSLVCHHIPTDNEIIEFLKKSIKVAKKAVIISDLERNFMAALSFKWIISNVFQNRLTRHDGLLSVKRSFTEEEWKDYLYKAGVLEYEIIKAPFFRFIILINVNK
jgi:2-polyprenyl-3-methyl-5-hydroxy-6-metoxy-1,4-benzoquinol methylase